MHMWRKYVQATTFIVALTTMALPFGSRAEIITESGSVASNAGLYGGQPEDIAVDSTSNAVYVANFAPGGIFSSTDKGETWSGLPASSNYGTGKAVEVDQTTGTVYALIGDSIINSTDQGVNWTDLTSGVGNAVLGQTMLFAHNTLMIADMQGGVYISTDDGATFSHVSIDTTGHITSFAAATLSSTYYVVVRINDASEKLYTSTNGGSTWTDMAVSSHGLTSSNRFYEVGVDPLNDSHIVMISDVPSNGPYQTTDGGSSWTTITNGSFSINGGYVTFDSTGRVYIGSYYSDNATAGTPTWTQFTVTTPLSSIYGDQAAVDPSNDDILFTNSGFGVAKSVDHGVTWTDEYDGITSVKIYDISQTTDKAVVWLGANGGLAKSTDFTSGSPTWSYPILPAPGTSSVKAIWVQPDDANIVVAGLGTFLSKSTDGGTTWTQATAPIFSGQVQDIVQSPVTPTTLYAIHWNDSLAGADSGGVFMSTDTGTTWTDLALPDSASAVTLAIATDDTLYVGIGGDATTKGVYTYTSGTWTKLAEDFGNGKITSILTDPADANTVRLTVETSDNTPGLYVSTDAGATWTTAATGLTGVNNLDTLTLQTSTTPDTLYVAGQNLTTLNGEIYKSSDSGATWNLYYTGLKQEQFYAMLFDGLLAGNDRGLYKLKTRASLKLKQIDDALVLTLKDASTHKKLKRKLVTVYTRLDKSKPWVKLEKIKTNKKGIATLSGPLTAGTKVKAIWKPKKQDRAEYRKANSRVLQVK